MSRAQTANGSGGNDSTARRADAFVRQLGATLVASSATGGALDAVAVRAQLQSVLRGLPASKPKQLALRDYLLDATHMDEAVQTVLSMRAEDVPAEVAAKVQARAEQLAAPALFSAADYERALSALDASEEDASVSPQLAGYLPLLLPSSSPVEVASHLMRSLTAKARRASTAASVQAFLAQPSVMAVMALPKLGGSSLAATQHRLEMQLQFARALPLHPACVLPLSALIDAAALHFALVKALASSPHSLRRVQYTLAALLLEEARRRPLEGWTVAGSVEVFAARVRAVLRSLPHEHAFTSSFVGDIMFLQMLFGAVKEYVLQQKSSATAAAAEAAAAAASKKGKASKRSRSRSPASHARLSSVPLFDSPASLVSLVSLLLGDVVRALGRGHRRTGGDAESELVRFAVLVRSVEALGLPTAQFGTLMRLVHSTAQSMPDRALPNSLRPVLLRFGPALQSCKQLWLAHANSTPQLAPSPQQARLSIAQLQKVLRELDGDFDAVEQQNGEDADDEEHAAKRARAATTSFDSFGVARSADASFFTGVSSAAPADADEGAEGTGGESMEDAAVAGGVAANMSRILHTLPQRPVEPPTKQRGGRKVKAAAAAAAAAAAGSEDEEEAAAADAAADAAARDAAAAGGPAPAAVDAAAAMEDDSPADEEAEPEVKSEPKKAGARGKRVKAESQEAPAEEPQRPARSTRARK